MAPYGSAIKAWPSGQIMATPMITRRGGYPERYAVKLQLRHSLAAIAADPGHARAGCLLSYGVDFEDSFRRTAEYVDRILRGENPANLPVQQPTKYKLVINLKAAKALGIEMPASVLARADEVIE